MKKIFLLFNFFCGTFGFINAQNVYIPDPVFKEYLISPNNNIDTNRDGEIQVSEAENYEYGIFCGYLNIINLQGIEAFINLKELGCQYTQITNLNLSKNVALQFLNCASTPLLNLDLSNNPDLIVLNCSYTKLTNLDMSKNILLQQFFCSDSKLENLNLQNGSNTTMWLMYSHNNPDLSCIQVDNVSYANAQGGWTKPNTASYSTDCEYMSVKNTNKNGIIFYPNPVKDILKFSEEVSNIRILDVSGKVVQQIPDSRVSINLIKLSKGIYIVTATTKSGEIISKKIIKD